MEARLVLKTRPRLIGWGSGPQLFAKLIFMNHTSVITSLIQLTDDVQFHHWNTTSYSEHMALGATYKSLKGLKDTIVEHLVGYYGRFNAIKLLPLPSCGLSELPECIMECATSLKTLATKDKHPDLINIADEVTGVGAKLQYLLSLK